MSKDDFYAKNPKRAASHVLRYGGSWVEHGFTDSSHVIDVEWFSATNELVAFYVTFDWNQLAPGKLDRDELLGAGGDIALDSGAGIGRFLGDLDLAAVDAQVEILATLDSHRECEEIMWGWRWWQHHPDGLDYVRSRIKERLDQDRTQTPGQ